MGTLLPAHETERLAALREYHLQGIERENAYDDLVRLAAYLCGTPIAAVSVVDAQRQWFVSLLGADVQETPRELAFCAHTILQPDILIIPDTQADPRFAGNPLVTQVPYVRFYAGAPLVTECGHALGTLCVLDQVPRLLTDHQQDALKTLARQVVGQMEQTRQVAVQAQLNRERAQAEDALHQSHRALQMGESRLVEAQRIGRIGDWELNMATQRFTWSAEVFRLMEFDPAAGEPSYETVQARYQADDRANRDRLFARALATGEPYGCDIQLILPSGTPRWCRLIGQPERNNEGQVIRVAGTVLDITERVEREQQIQDANLILEAQKAQLEAANVELKALARTDPLTGLLNHRSFQTQLAEEASRVQRQSAALAVVMLDIDNFQFFNDVYSHGTGDAVLRQVAERLRQVCRPYDTLAHFGGDEFALILSGIGEATEAELTARLKADLADLTFYPSADAAIPINLSLGVAFFTDISMDYHEVLQQAEARLMRCKTGGEVETEADRVRAHTGDSLDGFSMLDALVTAVDNKDRYTRRHSEDVMDYSVMIAQELGLPPEEQRMVAVAALLHDVGKIGVPDHILRKPGKLSEAEFAVVQQHPQMGAVIVQAVPGLADTLDAVRHHHERWDGGGYPHGLRGEAIPRTARLMAVADAFSAMTMDRPYRRSLEHETAFSILQAGKGSQWDPECVEAFLRAHGSRHHLTRFS